MEDSDQKEDIVGVLQRSVGSESETGACLVFIVLYISVLCISVYTFAITCTTNTCPLRCHYSCPPLPLFLAKYCVVLYCNLYM